MPSPANKFINLVGPALVVAVEGHEGGGAHGVAGIQEPLAARLVEDVVHLGREVVPGKVDRKVFFLTKSTIIRQRQVIRETANDVKLCNTFFIVRSEVAFSTLYY